METSKKKIILIVLLVLIAALSFFAAAKVATDEENFTGIYNNLDQKRTTVTELMGGAAASATAISLLPGLAGTPIADQLADLSGYFLFILAAVCFEKWLVTLTGALAFKILIPIACAILIVALLIMNDSLKIIGVKLLCFALMVFAVVPASVFVSQKIDDSYQASIQQTIQDAKEDSQELQEQVGDEQDEGIIENLINKIQGGVRGQIKNFETILSQLTESIAVLIVTSCAIPIAVLIFFIWLIRLITGISFQIPSVRMSRAARRMKDMGM